MAEGLATYSEDRDGLVRSVTVVTMANGRCLAPFPGGAVEAGEHWVVTALREVERAGLELRSLHPFGILPGGRAVAWAEVTPPGGPGVELTPEAAELARLAARAREALSDEDWFRDNRILLERAYLSHDDPYRQSGKRDGAAGWELARRFTAAALHRDGTFLDVGCANGLLMESIVEWARLDRGLTVEPYGLDISAELVELARRRLPRWADRIWLGNGWDWRPPRRFDFVHTLPELVPDHLRGRWLRRLLEEFLAPDGRLLLRWGDPYPENPDRRRLRDVLSDVGVAADGELVQERPGKPAVRVGWLSAR